MRAATEQAVSASISTPVRSTVSTWASTSIQVSSIRKFTRTAPTSSGWHSGIRSGGALGGLDAGHPGHGEHIALGDRAPGDERRGLGLHVHPGPGDGPAVARLLGRDVDHAGPAQRIEVGEAAVGHGRSYAARPVAGAGRRSAADLAHRAAGPDERGPGRWRGPAHLAADAAPRSPPARSSSVPPPRSSAAQVVVVDGEQAGAELAVGGEPDAVARGRRTAR